MFKVTPFHYWKTKIIPADCVNGHLKFSRQLKMQENIGTDQLEQAGLTAEEMMNRNFVFVIVNSSTRYYNLPSENQPITLTTMPTGKKGVHYYRAYLFDDDKGNRLIESYSDFILVDPKEHKIVSPNLFSDICELIESEPDVSIGRPSRVRLPKDMQEVGSVTVDRKDIDINNHLNNSVYWDYIYEFLPCPATDVEQINMSYLAEGLFGDTIKIFRKIDEGKIFISGEHGRGVSFAAEIIKKNK